MPIEPILPRMRGKIAWLGEDPPADAHRAFVEREYRVERCEDSDLRNPEYLAGVSSVVLTQSSEEPEKVAQALQEHADRLLDYDCRILLRATEGSDAILGAISSLGIPAAGLPDRGGGTKADPPLPFARYFDSSVPWSAVANFVQACPHRPSLNLALRIDSLPASPGGTPSLPSIDALLRRAFWDCSSVCLEPMHGARSGAALYRVHAELQGAMFGSWTQPFVIKVGDRAEILGEYETYAEKVHPYVPFHLGPHLDYNRCCLGARSGLLVLNYVTESEKLLRCASEGRAAPAIACLFDRALLGWYHQAREVDVPFSQPLIASFPEIVDERRMAAARSLGASLEVGALRALFDRCRSQPVLVGPIHGDLHATNVCVRGTDAVIIDFATQDHYPLLVDAATLEASLLVEGDFAPDADPNVWFDDVKPLYKGNLLACKAPQVAPTSALSWLYANIRQIRGYARRWECGKNQYAAALSLALLKKAKKDPDTTGPEASRRAAAYAFAELVLRHAFPS